MTIIGLTGLAQSGKSTVAKVLVEEYGYTELGFADQLRGMAAAIDPYVYKYDDTRYTEALDLDGYEAAKRNFPEVRRFLQQLGTEARNFLGSEVWIDAWANALPIDQTLIRDINGVVIRTTTTVGDVVTPDVRFLNEAAAIKAFGGVLIRVVREGSGLTGSAGQHPSELEQSEIVADYEIENNGTIADLHRAVAAIIGDLSRAAA